MIWFVYYIYVEDLLKHLLIKLYLLKKHKYVFFITFYLIYKRYFSVDRLLDAGDIIETDDGNR